MLFAFLSWDAEFLTQKLVSGGRARRNAHILIISNKKRERSELQITKTTRNANEKRNQGRKKWAKIQMSTGRNVFNRFVYPKNKNNVLLLDVYQWKSSALNVQCTHNGDTIIMRMKSLDKTPNTTTTHENLERLQFCFDIWIGPRVRRHVVLFSDHRSMAWWMQLVYRFSATGLLKQYVIMREAKR